MHICLGGPIYTMDVGRQRVTFEMHRVCGPVPIRGSDHRERRLSENHAFWKVVTKWGQSGQRVDEHGRCIMGDIIPPTMVERKQGRRYIAPDNGWTCFHCGQTFLTKDAARKHFGETPATKPECTRDTYARSTGDLR